MSGSPSVAQDELDAESAAEQIQALMTSAGEQLQAGEFEAALQTLNQVIQAGGGYSAAPLLLRAKAFAGLEEYQSALEDLKNADTYSQATPQLIPEIKNTRAEIFMELGNYQGALADLQEATKLVRGVPKIQFNYGKTLVLLGGVQEGEKALTDFLESEEAAADDELRAEALSLRGRAFGFLNKIDEAQRDLAASLSIDPTNHEAYLARATLYINEKAWDQASEDLLLSIENYTAPEGQESYPFIQGYLSLASVYEEIGKEALSESQANESYQEAIRICNDLIALMPENDPNMDGAKSATLFRRAVNERLSNEFRNAVKSFSQALRLNAELGDAYFRRGICFYYLDEERLAIRDFEQAASINFDSPRANLWQGMSWAKLGDYNEAIRAYGESLAVSDRYIPAYVNRGLAHMHQGDYEKAIDDFNEAIRLKPNDATHYYRRGKAYSFIEESDRAIKSFTLAIEFDPRLAPAYLAMASELRETGRPELAAEYERQAAELDL